VRRKAGSSAAAVLGGGDASLLDLIDQVLQKGVLVSGDVVFGLAGIDLVYARLSVLLCTADRVLGSAAEGVPRSGRRTSGAARRPSGGGPSGARIPAQTPAGQRAALRAGPASQAKSPLRRPR
jgi:Gas vesicle protein